MSHDRYSQTGPDFELNPDPGQNSDPVCLKSVWIMRTLCDDEVAGDSLPAAVKLHLAQCPTCKSLADQLQAVTSDLASLAEGSPALDLQNRANEQLQAALDHGASMTGRVEVAELIEPADLSSSSKFSFRQGYWVAAAVLLLALGASWIMAPSDSASLMTVTHPSAGDPTSLIIKTPPENLPILVSADEDQPLADEPSPKESPPPSTKSVWVFPTFTNRSPSRLSPRSLDHRRCRHRSHLETAMCEKPGAVHSVIMSPVRIDRRNP